MGDNIPINVYESMFAKSESTDVCLIIKEDESQPAKKSRKLTASSDVTTSPVLTRKMYVNRATLSKRSTVFEGMFAASPDSTEFTINDAKYDELTAVLSVTEPTPIDPTEENVEGILRLADRFMLLDATRYVESFISRSGWDEKKKNELSKKFNLKNLSQRRD
ncbi:hypothetical protein CRE_19790 [Caenorhabditis remanei]|uniref:BTB domain-containing protein n=1 Tax=Caenorhabditis remanei TaxID=31234 RepID=E3MTB6_CAERE|nr:hypothetical protein CRE_19790 [Caenorhabditis remanei]